MASFCENYHGISNCSHIGASPVLRYDSAKMLIVHRERSYVEQIYARV